MILIVGGGPAGSLSAIALKNYDVTVVEEHSSAGFPVQCAGLISERCYRELKKFSDCKVNDIRGAVFFSPNNSVELEGKVGAVVVERKLLDRDLLAKASEYANVMIKTKFLGVEKGKAVLRSMGKKIELDYDYIIGADGVYSTVSNVFNFKKPEVYSALQITCRFECISDDLVEIYFGFSDYFCYAIPFDEFAKIGVISSQNPMPVMRRLLRWLGKRVKGSVLELNAGAIPIGLVDFVKDRVMLIGDSAGMVKPYTGGGLYYILKAVEKLKHFPNLKKVQKEYVKDLRIEYKVGTKIAKLYRTLEPEDYDYLIGVAREHGDLARELDMDRPSTLLKLIPLILKIVKRRKILMKLSSLL
ncbi:FAD-dependent monooxygenase [Archaeoglobus profundus]|uniref:Dehydrogenase (Flavoprotein)-like protein n=1 Tax=Archaeoglobus profundus (strain DSM 5631 / JCM 9629 / NBRC 100127 / Av18) TaxID=572546 RepID=D2RGA8_ARCPA|nr:NAD(P)/FAD-dependent oxidoreductase [Archaeoglobus profundus]ADB57333.1 Dehydrogenase (flavoprotein)-like protein [Archaeoglobus profundus DSM 5631]